MAKNRLIREAGRYAKDAVRKMFMSFSKLNQETLNDDFPETEKRIVSDAYLQDAWVANCVDLIARNVGRADFVVMKEGKKVSDSAAARLFEFPSPVMSRYFIFWKQKSEEEQQVLEKCLKKYKINLIATHEYQLFEGDIERVIYFLQK